MEERDIALLAESGAVLSVIAQEGEGSWTLIVNGKTVRSARQVPRPFKTLEAIASMLRKVGVYGFTVELRKG